MPLDSTTHLPEETETKPKITFSDQTTPHFTETPAELRKRMAQILRECPYPQLLGAYTAVNVIYEGELQVCAATAIAIGLGIIDPKKISRFGLPDPFPDIKRIDNVFWYTKIDRREICDLNDKKGLSFAQIADRIEFWFRE